MDTTPWHALVGLGTDGGDPLADGDRLARGIHLLWSWRPALGFPVGGYDVWRRRHQPPIWWCLDISDHWPIPDNGGEFFREGFRLVANPGPTLLDPLGCFKRPALVLPGVVPHSLDTTAARTLEAWSPQRAAVVRGKGIGPPPKVEVFAGGRGSSPVLVARQQADGHDRERWSFEIWSEGITGVRLTAPTLKVCELCFGVPHVFDGWEKLTDRPILLPVVDPAASNAPEHIHDRRRTRRIAASRLSNTLDERKRRRLADGFSDQLRELTEQLLRDGRDARLPEQPATSTGSRLAPSLGLSTAGAIALTAVDPDVARMLGLYWHDGAEQDPSDYKVVAHHAAVRYPSRRITFDDLAREAVTEPLVTHQGLRILSSGGIQVIQGGRSGRVLRVAAPRPGTVAALQLADSAPALTLHFDDGAVGSFTAWRNGTSVVTGVSVGNSVTLEHEPGIDAVTWFVGSVTLRAVELFAEAGVVGDLTAYAWNLAPVTPSPVHALALTDARGAVDSPRLETDGSVNANTAIIGLDWASDDAAQNVGTAVRVHVARSDRGDGVEPIDSGAFVIRNEGEPALAVSRPDGRGFAWPGPDVPHRWTERGLRPGWYAWRVRGIDAFGRLGGWSAGRVVEARFDAPPPPPDAVVARYLDPADPFLSPDDRVIADADGPGLLVEWTWPAERRLRAPQVEPAGEFRVYLRRDDPNVISGNVLTVVDLGDRSRLTTDTRVAGPSTLVGELVRLGRASFTIAAAGSGPDAWIEVLHLTAPTARPAPGPFTIRVSPGNARLVDLSDPLAFELRHHAQPIGDLARVRTRVAQVVDRGDVVEVTLNQPLPPAGTEVVPGLFVSRGLAFSVVDQTPGSSRIDVRSVVQPDGTRALPLDGDAGTLWAGARYRAWLPRTVLRPKAAEPLALGLVAVTTSDGDPAVADQVVWSDGQHGTLGARPGRESRTSRVARIRVPHRGAPPPVPAPRPPEVGGDIPAVQADPADWHGRARYDLAFSPVAGATGYRVLRASVAALFARDRLLRQTTAEPYTNGPFTPGNGSDAWLAEHYADLTTSDLTADLTTHPHAPRVLEAWRAWAAWYYPQLLNKEVMDLADLAGNQEAFMPAHEGTIAGPTYRDTIDGRGLGRFVYRVRSVDASGNAGEWSQTFPIVEVRDVTPPKTPTVVSAKGSDNLVSISWLPATEPDVATYRLWRALDPTELIDVRRAPAHATVAADTATLTRVSFADQGLVGLQTYHYRIAAVDRSGNVSDPTSVISVRVSDATPPLPAEWLRAEWVGIRRTHDPHLADASEDTRSAVERGVALEWLATETGLTSAVERRRAGERTWTSIAQGLKPQTPGETTGRRFAYFDRTAIPTRSTEYRVRVADPVGNTNWQVAPVASVPALKH